MAKLQIGEKKLNYPLKTFTIEKMEAILKDLEEGSTKRHASEANGLSERHFYYAMKQGVYDLEHDKPLTLYAQLVQRLRSIEQKEIKLCRNNIRDRIKSHKGAEWTLEHVYWQWFGPNAQAMDMDERLRLLEQGDKSNESTKKTEGIEETSNAKETPDA